MSALMRRTPQFVLSMMTGIENTAMMKSSAGLAKPPMALPRLSTTPSTGHSTTTSRAVAPRGRAEVTHSATSAPRMPSAVAPWCERASEPGTRKPMARQTIANPIPIRRFAIGTLVFSMRCTSLLRECGAFFRRCGAGFPVRCRALDRRGPLPRVPHYRDRLRQGANTYVARSGTCCRRAAMRESKPFASTSAYCGALTLPTAGRRRRFSIWV